MPEHELALQAGSAQVQIAVFHAQFIAPVALFLNGKRGCFAGIQNVQLGNSNFNIAGGHAGVFAFAFGNGSADLQDKFPAQFPGLFGEFGAGLQVKGKLGNSVPVAQVNKGHSPQISVALHPTAQGNFGANVG